MLKKNCTKQQIMNSYKRKIIVIEELNRMLKEMSNPFIAYESTSSYSDVFEVNEYGQKVQIKVEVTTDTDSFEDHSNAFNEKNRNNKL